MMDFHTNLIFKKLYLLIFMFLLKGTTQQIKPAIDIESLSAISKPIKVHKVDTFSALNSIIEKTH